MVEVGQERLKIWRAKYDEESNRQCSICGKSFGTKYNLKLHLIQVHRKRVPNMTVHQCSLCAFITGSKKCMERHMLTHSRIKKKGGYEAVCSICHEKFANSSSLKRHKNRKHWEYYYDLLLLCCDQYSIYLFYCTGV